MKAHADPHLHTHVHTESPTDDYPHPIPASVTIVNDQTPLLHDHATNRTLHHRPSRSSLALSSDPNTRWKELGGLALMTLSALAFSFMALFVKVAGVLFPSLEVVLARSVVQLVFGLAACALLGLNPLGAKGLRRWLVLRGLAGSIGLALFFYSLTWLPLVEATALFFLGPTITILLAHFLDATPVRSSDTLLTLLSILGVALLARPQLVGAKPRAPEDTWPLAAALLGACMSAGAYVTARKVGRAVHFMVHVVYFGGVSTVLSVVALYAWQGGWVKPEDKGEWGWLIAVGGCAFVGQCLLNAGLHLAPPGPSTLLRPADVLLALLLGVTLLEETPTATTLAGSLLVTCATTAMGVTRTSPPTPKPSHVARERETRRNINKQASAETLAARETRAIKRQGSTVSVLSMPPEPEERRKRRKERRERERREREGSGDSVGTSEGSTQGSEPGSPMESEGHRQEDGRKEEAVETKREER